MTKSIEERAEEILDHTSGDWPGMGRRPLLKALSAGAALSAGSGVAMAGDDDDDDGEDDDNDQAEGFTVEVVAPHATFTDDVAAAFGIDYDDGPEDSAFLHDASTVVIAKVTIEPGGSSGWHIDHGPAIAVLVEGEVDVTFEDDNGCFTQTYEAGEAVMATGDRADLIENASDSEQAMGYVVFLGVSDGEPPSSSVEEPDC